MPEIHFAHERPPGDLPLALASAEQLVAELVHRHRFLMVLLGASNGEAVNATVFSVQSAYGVKPCCVQRIALDFIGLRRPELLAQTPPGQPLCRCFMPGDSWAESKSVEEVRPPDPPPQPCDPPPYDDGYGDEDDSGDDTA